MKMEKKKLKRRKKIILRTERHTFWRRRGMEPRCWQCNGNVAHWTEWINIGTGFKDGTGSDQISIDRGI